MKAEEMDMNDPRGSLWRRWDLHFHTPSSFDYENPSISDNQIVGFLLEANLAVVAITDHHVIDVHRIRNLQAVGSGKLTIFPGFGFLQDGDVGVGVFPEREEILTGCASEPNLSGLLWWSWNFFSLLFVDETLKFRIAM